MPDPRSNLFSVKPCPPAYLARSAANIGSMTSSRRNFFGALGKVGDLQILNKVGAGKIGAGLRTLASVSNTIRQGTGALPTSIGTALGQGMDAGSRWVLTNVGIAPSVVDALHGLHPEVANQALGQAGSIFQKVKQGNFKISSIPGVLQDLQNLERLGRNIFTPDKLEGRAVQERCEASPYAIDLIARAPKFKFLFVVEFVFDAGYADLQKLVFPFVVKTATRPKVRYTMEDANYYNFRTKIITKTEFEEMNMSFHDDTQNYATRFFNAYMRAYTPITNIPAASGLNNAHNNGMDFEQSLTNKNPIEGNIKSNHYTGSIGPLANDRPTVLSEIRILHVYDYGRKMNIFTFFNPRMTLLDLDDVDMSVGGEGSEFRCSFNYDSVYINTGEGDKGLTMSGTEQESANPFYPLRNTEAASGAGSSGSSGIGPFGAAAGIIKTAADAVTGVTTSILDQGKKIIGTVLPPVSAIPFISGGGIGGALGGAVTGTLSTINKSVEAAKTTASSIGGTISKFVGGGGSSGGGGASGSF